MTDTSAKLSFWFSNLGHYLTHMMMLLYPTVVLALEHQFHLTYGELLSLSLPGFILFGAAALPAGWLGDRWSEGGMLAVQFYGMGLAAVLTGFAQSPWQIALGLAMIGLFASIYHPVGTSLIVRAALNRGKALGINGICGSLGVASAALVAGALTDWLGWRAAFIVPGIAVLGVAVVFSLVLRSGHFGGAKVDRKPQRDHSSRVLFWSFLALAVASSSSGVIYNATTVALPKVFAERLAEFGATGVGVGSMVSIVYLVAGLTQLVGGALADRYPLKTLYLISYLLQVPLLIVAAGLSSLPMLGISTVMVALQVGTVPIESSLYAHYSSSKWRGTAFGAKFVISLGVSALAVPLVGFIHDRTGSFFALFIVMGLLALVAAAISLLLPAERGSAAAAPVPAPAQGD